MTSIRGRGTSPQAVRYPDCQAFIASYHAPVASLPLLPPHNYSCRRIYRQNQRLILCVKDGAIRIYDLSASGQEVMRIASPDGSAVNAASFHPFLPLLAAATGTKTRIREEREREKEDRVLHTHTYTYTHTHARDACRYIKSYRKKYIVRGLMPLRGAEVHPREAGHQCQVCGGRRV